MPANSESKEAERAAGQAKAKPDKKEKLAAVKTETDDDASGPAAKKRNTVRFIILTAVLIIIMVALVAVPQYLKKTKFENDKYNNFEFVFQDNLWYTMLQIGNQPYWVPFYYHPKGLEDIPVEIGLRAKFFALKDNNGSIYITIDPDGKDNKIVIAGVEIAKITGQAYKLLNVPTHSAFINPPKNASVNSETPIVTCSQSGSKTMVIWLTLSDKNIVYSRGNCIILEAKTYNDTVRVADRAMYNLLGVMLD
ncbi:MAG: hypothetical protein V1866_01265 [archaeon]